MISLLDNVIIDNGGTYAIINQLQDMLHSINRKSYPAYKSLKGAYQFKKYVLSIDHVQGDPFASPSHVSVKIFHREAGFPAEYYKDKLTRITLADYLTRRFEQQVNRYTFRAKGSGKSGLNFCDQMRSGGAGANGL